MKKNYSLRIAGFLLILVLLSTCLISGTFAKYTTSGSNNDAARVAKWGVEVKLQGSKAFDTKYGKDDTTATITNSVSGTSSNIDNLLAPGTKGTLFSISTTGTPEVAVKATANFTLTLNGWEISGSESTTEEYCPLVFTVKKGSNTSPKIFKIGTGEGEYKSIAELISNLKSYIEENANAEYEPGVTFNSKEAYNLTVEWEWAFEGNDAKDTALGDLNSAPTINFSYELSLTQID